MKGEYYDDTFYPPPPNLFTKYGYHKMENLYVNYNYDISPHYACLRDELVESQWFRNDDKTPQWQVIMKQAQKIYSNKEIIGKYKA